MPPPDVDINMFIEVCGGGIGREVAIRFLEGSGNNLESAMNEYYANPTKYDQGYQGWDPSQFSADRDGGVGDAGIPSFTIDAGDDGAIYPGSSSAPTRPPSRRSNYSTRSTGQENGVINGKGQDQMGRKYFGPVTRDEAAYVPDQWAMVPVSSSAARVYDNPEPADRVRNKENGEPVFFKPLREKDGLPSLITVLGQIPVAKKELLRAEVQLDSYGGNDRWWDGESATTGQARLLDDTEIPQEQVVAEAQRLMAFVQGSDRSFGSVEVLNALEGISNVTAAQILRKEGVVSYSGELRFMVGWSSAAEMYAVSNQSSSSIFRTTMVVDEPKSGFKEETSEDIFRLDLSMSTSEPKQSLYQAIDDTIWANDPRGEEQEDFYISRVAPVLVMRVQNQHTASTAKGLGMQVPISFYADRYLKDNYALLKEMRQSKETFRQQVRNVDEKKRRLQQTPHPKDSTKMLESEELFGKTIEYLRKKDKPPGTPMPPKKKDGDDAMQGQLPLMRTPWDDLADRLETYHGRLQQKLKDLDAQRASLEDQMAKLSNILTENANVVSNAEAPQPNHTYVLRGVGIGPAYETTFVYVDAPTPAEPTAMDADGQWWRFDFASAGTSWQTPEKKPVTEAEVLSETSDETKEALLIYTSQEACDPRHLAGTALGPALSAFVEADNAAFAREIEDQRAEEVLPQSEAMLDVDDGWPAATTSSTDEPPPYSSEMMSTTTTTTHVEDVGDSGWAADPGPSIVSDADYTANTTEGFAGLGGGRGVSTEMRGRAGVDET